MKDTVKVMKFIFNFLDQLSESELTDVLNNKVELKLESKSNKNTITKKDTKNTSSNNLPTNQLKDICDGLETMSSRAVAMDYLEKQNITKANLKAIASRYNIPVTTKDTNAKLIAKIVEGVVGSKLRFDALLDTDLK